MTPPLPLYLVRLAPEVTTKSRRTRRRFQDRLVANLDDALAGLGGARSIRNKWDRIHVEAEHPGAGERMYIILNHAIGHAAPSPSSGEPFPKDMQVDYVKAWNTV